MKRILALIEAADHVCYRYRIRPFEPYLRAAGWALEAHAVATGTVARIRQARRAADFDAVLLQRRLLPGWFHALLRRNARRLVFDFDDAVQYRDSYDRRGPECSRRGRRFDRVLRTVDAVIAGNAFLAESARSRGQTQPSRVCIVPTCVEIQKYREAPPQATHAGSQGLEMVWIGSSSTLQGLEQVSSLWSRIGREIPGVRLKLISDRFTRFDGMPIVDCRWRPSSEFEDLHHSDLGVSWLPDDVWSRGKCGLKLLQYRAAGLPVVTNPVGVHGEIVRDGVDGILAADETSWVEAIRRLAADPELRAEMGRRARADVMNRYVPQQWATTWVQAVTGVEVRARPHAASVSAPMGPSKNACGAPQC
jgi:glycosyltransferase involved in cell wall biosynthesis